MDWKRARLRIVIEIGGKNTDVRNSLAYTYNLFQVGVEKEKLREKGRGRTNTRAVAKQKNQTPPKHPPLRGPQRRGDLKGLKA